MATVNQTIGSHYDQVNNRTFYFDWNSGGNHSIYMMDWVTEIITPLVIVGPLTDGDILGFNLQVPIIGVNIIYGDATQGDILYFLDCLGRPSKINIQRALAGNYGLITRNAIDVIKAPPIIPPRIVYENDNNVTVNNLRNTLFQFASIYESLDKDKSVLSSWSDVPLPYQPFNQVIDADGTKNSRIAIYIETGSKDVRKLIIVGRQTQNSVTSEWYRITVLDKAQLNIPDNSIYRFVFYNDSIYSPIDPKWAALLFDNVPKKAEAQEILNGVIPAYGGTYEGYDYFTPTITLQNGVTLLPYNIHNGVLFFAYQNNAHTITLFLSGVGTNDANNNTQALSRLFATLTVNVIDVTSANKSFNVASSGYNVDISSELNALATAANAQGFYIDMLSSNSIVLKSNTPFTLQSSSIVRTSGAPFTENDVQFVLAPEANYPFAIQYFDEEGRTIGALVPTNGSVTTQPYTNNVDASIKLPLISLSIFNRPPLEAKYFHILRGNQQTYGKMFHWVSNSAYSNYTVSTGIPQTFAYIGIDNIDTFNLNNGTTNNVVGYEFGEGDRIRFISKIDVNGNVDNLFKKDYAILGVTVNPIINGVVKVGRFVKINYPTADISSTFGFNGTDSFQNYHIFIYSLAAHNNANTAVYFEFNKEYGIGNAGATNAYHFGDTPQTSDLTQPAIINIADGELFYRYRKVPVGITYDIPTEPFEFGDIYATYKTILPAPIITTNYAIRNQVNHTAGITNADYPVYTDTDCAFENLSGGVIVFGITGNLQIWSNGASVASVVVKIISPANVVSLVTVLNNATILVDETKNFVFDGSFEVPAGYKVFGLLGDSASADNFHVNITELKYKIIRNISIPIVEDSYSDIYAIRTSPNSRASVSQPDSKATFYPNIIRYGGEYQPDTNINNTNRFYFQDYVEVDRSRGAIKRLIIEERQLYIYQERAVGVQGIYSRFLKQDTGENVEVTTDIILSNNNVQYLLGEYGCNNYPESIVRTKNAHAFVDVLRGYLIIRYNNGLQAVSELHYGQYLIRGMIMPYNVPRVQSNGGKAKIIGTYDYLNEQFIFVLQSYQLPAPANQLIVDIATNLTNYRTFTFTGRAIAGYTIHITVSTNGTSTETFDYQISFGQSIEQVVDALLELVNDSSVYFATKIGTDQLAIGAVNITAGYSFTFDGSYPTVFAKAFTYNLLKQGFNDFPTIYPEWIGNAQEKVIHWLNGNIYPQDSSIRNTFFGVLYDSEITIVFRSSEFQKKTWKSITEVSNVIWDCPEIVSQLDSFGMTKQQSNLVINDFRKLEGNYSSSFKRDVYSAGGLINGHQLKGDYLQIKFRAIQPTSLVFLSLISITYIDSPLNATK